VPDGDDAFEQPLPNRLLRRVAKVVIVTGDLDGCVRAWSAVAGIRPWHLFDRDVGRVGWAVLDRVLIEVVEPRAAGPHKDVLDRRGEGVAFLGVLPDEDGAADVLGRALELGYERLGHGPVAGDGGRSVFLGARRAIGTDLELLPSDPVRGFEAVTPDRIVD
jgi:hypothetical protein